MNKKELIIDAAQRAGLTQKDTQAALDAVLTVIADRLRDGDKVTISGFGCFQKKERKAKVGHNIIDRRPIEIPATAVPVFQPSDSLKKAVKETT